MIYKHASPVSGYVRVTFELPASLWADHVYLVGDFNQWDNQATPLRIDRSGIWRVSLDLPANRRFEFRYIIDDHWCTDQHADGCVANDYRGYNSYVDTVLPLAQLAESNGGGLVHESRPARGYGVHGAVPG